MILADTTIWIDYFRTGDPHMRKLLTEAQIAIHPFIVAELALGSLTDRIRTLAYLDMLPTSPVAQLREVRAMIEAHTLHGKGIGLIDAHLLASTLMAPPLRLWTRNKRLRSIAAAMGLHADLA